LHVVLVFENNDVDCVDQRPKKYICDDNTVTVRLFDCAPKIVLKLFEIVLVLLAKIVDCVEKVFKK
jgi:membrane-bound inhibitor of C-type lysozyme